MCYLKPACYTSNALLNHKFCNLTNFVFSAEHMEFSLANLIKSTIKYDYIKRTNNQRSVIGMQG